MPTAYWGKVHAPLPVRGRRECEAFTLLLDFHATGLTRGRLASPCSRTGHHAARWRGACTHWAEETMRVARYPSLPFSCCDLVGMDVQPSCFSSWHTVRCRSESDAYPCALQGPWDLVTHSTCVLLRVLAGRDTTVTAPYCPLPAARCALCAVRCPAPVLARRVATLTRPQSAGQCPFLDLCPTAAAAAAAETTEGRAS